MTERRYTPEEARIVAFFHDWYARQEGYDGMHDFTMWENPPAERVAAMLRQAAEDAERDKPKPTPPIRGGLMNCEERDR